MKRSSAAFCVFASLCFVRTAHGQTQMDMTSDACAQYKKADDALNDVYKQVIAINKKDRVLAGKIKEAQRTWVKFRDAHLNAVYPAVDKQTEYGSIYPMCNCSEMASLTNARTEQLKQWLSTEEGDVCAGSRWKGAGE